MSSKNKHPKQLLETFRSLIFCYQQLFHYGQKIGAVDQAGIAVWNIMKSIQPGGQTMVSLAKERSVSRQYIQQRIKKLIELDWVDLTDNPKHKKSKLIQLTSKGNIQLNKIEKKLMAEAILLNSQYTQDFEVLNSALNNLKQLISKRCIEIDSIHL